MTTFAAIGVLLSLMATGSGVPVQEIEPSPVVWATPSKLEKRADVISAARLLAAEIRKRNWYPGVPPGCLAYDLESVKGGNYDFAIRFNQAKCGGTSPSNLMDRARVIKKTGEVLWWNESEFVLPSKRDEM